ncbi:LTA synthase family protein [Elongatibacter sediminis]
MPQTEQPRTPLQTAARFTPLLLLALLAILIAVRVHLVDRNLGTYLACPGCFDTMVLAADTSFLAALAGVLLLAGVLRPLWLGRAVQVGAGVLVVVYATDLIVFRLFNARLFLSDIRLFLVEPAATWNQLSSGLGGVLPGAAVLLGALALLVWLAWTPPARGRRQRILLAAVLSVSLIAAAITRGGVYVNDWAVDNVLVANLSTSAHTPYSEDHADEVRARQPRPWRLNGPAPGIVPPTTLNSDATRSDGLNVIVLMLESWSAWHSEAWGGYEAWTPQLDAAAKRGRSYTNFHAIGFSTDRGLVGILAGQQLWEPFLHLFETPPFHSMWGVERSLPRAFTPHGYHTAFLTSGPLTLYRKGEWLADLGFDEVEGNEHAFYESEPRYAFGAASDDALYRRAAAWMDGASAPYLLVLETVTTHQPYTDPTTGERSLKGAMQFADRAFGEFLADLDRRRFFDRGVLVVASDHRSMTPVPARELSAWGAAALSRVPAFIIGPGFEAGSRGTAVHSQADLVPSFELWLGGATDLEAHQAVMFGAASNVAASRPDDRPRCAFHGRMDQRGRVDVHCGTGHGQVRLDGDRTEFVGSQGLDADTRSGVLDTLALLRLQGLERHLNHTRSPEPEPARE